MNRLALREPAHVAVFDPYATGELDLRSCAEFAEAFPSIPMFAYGAFPGHFAEDVFQLARLGVCGVATLHRDDLAAPLRLRLTTAMAHTVIGEVLAALEGSLDPPLISLLRYLLSAADGPLSPEDAARFHHSTERTLRRHLRNAGLPSIQRLMVWTRLLQAAHLLQDPGISLKNVTFRLGFASTNSFRNQLRRCAGITPSELRGPGRFRHLLRMFREECGGVGTFGQVREPMGATLSGNV